MSRRGGRSQFVIIAVAAALLLVIWYIRATTVSFPQRPRFLKHGHGHPGNDVAHDDSGSAAVDEHAGQDSIGEGLSSEGGDGAVDDGGKESQHRHTVPDDNDRHKGRGGRYGSDDRRKREAASEEIHKDAKPQSAAGGGDSSGAVPASVRRAMARLDAKERSLKAREAELDEHAQRLKAEEERLQQLREELLQEKRSVAAACEHDKHHSGPASDRAGGDSPRRSKPSAPAAEGRPELPCPVNPLTHVQCSGGQHYCNATSGRCKCKLLQQEEQQKHSGDTTATEHNSKLVKVGGKACELRKESGKPLVSLIALPSPLAPTVVKSFKKNYPQYPTLYHHGEADEEEEEGTEKASAERAFESLNAQLHQVRTPLVLVSINTPHIDIGVDSALDLPVKMMMDTSADIIGGLVHDKKKNGLLRTPCWEFKHHAWILRHRKAPFGYRRHEKYLMYCDRTSDTFLAKTSVLRGLLNGWNATMGSMAHVDLFLRVFDHNKHAVNVSRWEFKELAPTRVSGYVMVGTCSEWIIPTAPLPDTMREDLNAVFAEQHQVEAYFNPEGTRSELVCTRSGGILAHSKKGLYSPLCHRAQRQRDFLFLTDLWLNPHWATPAGAKHASSKYRYAVSVHHGNLFGAMRLGVELLWETDGDFDLVCFGCEHQELMTRFTALQEAATKAGFTYRVTYRMRPWYSSFFHNKTDFQLNVRSPNDALTRGKPPQVHNVSVWYQGMQVHVNGFSNPWVGIRADPGHDYRDQYLAQQGWVLHFTSDAISCAVKGHNACLPDCNSFWKRADHNHCSDDEITAEFRDPALWSPAGAEEDFGTEEQVRRRRMWSPHMREFL